jgi:ABC-2 type transport system ATP-binding protein
LEKTADMLILIHEGKIIFERSKDELLDTFRIVKGNGAWLNDQNRPLIKNPQSIRLTVFRELQITSQK